MAGDKEKTRYANTVICLMMLCMRPILRKLVLSTVKRQSPRGRRSWGIDKFLANNKGRIEKELLTIDHNNMYRNVLYPSVGETPRTDIQKWDLTLYLFILIDICRINRPKAYFFKQLFGIRNDFCKSSNPAITRDICKDYRKRIKKLRSKFYRHLRDDELKEKIENRANEIESGEMCSSEIEEVLQRWKDLEVSKVVSDAKKKTGIDKYLIVKTLLSKCCAEVMRALVIKTSNRNRPSKEHTSHWSLDKFLRQHKSRIERRIHTVDKLERPMDTLFPRKGQTKLDEWDESLLFFILLNVCYLDEHIADNVADIRSVRNEILHSSKALNLTDSQYESYLERLKRSIKACLIFMDDQDLYSLINAQVYEIEFKEEHKDETILRLQPSYEKDREDHEKQKRFRGVHERAQNELAEIVKKFKSVEMSELQLELVIRHSSQELEKKKKLSKCIVENINRIVKSEKGLPTSSENDDDTEMTIAVANLVEKWKSKGWVITEVMQSEVKEDLEIGESMKMTGQLIPILDSSDFEMSSLDNNKQTMEVGTEDELVTDSSCSIDSWETCLQRHSESVAICLLENNKLPNKRQLEEISEVFEGRHESSVLRKCCSKISEHIKGLSEKITDVLPAYTIDEGGKANVAFVICTNEDIDLKNELKYEYVIRVIGKCSNEAKDVTFNKENETFKMSSDDEKKIKAFIEKNSRDLLKRHSMLSGISASSIKSINYGTDKWEKINCPCVVFYVHTKKYIPLDEGPFEKQYGGISVDVREGAFTTLGRDGNCSTKYQRDVEIACEVGGANSSGTLSGYLELPDSTDTFGFTCAHSVLSSIVLSKSLEKSGNTTFNNQPANADEKLGSMVYQPANSEELLGNVVQVVYQEGGSGTSGMEIAVFKLQKARCPISGKISDFERETNEHIFDTGRVAEHASIQRREEVKKFGSASGISQGRIAFDGATVRKLTFSPKHNGCVIILHNQLEIWSCNFQEKFADKGDSGAPVFVSRNDELNCVGIVEGGYDNGNCIVTPVDELLRKLAIPSLKDLREGHSFKMDTTDYNANFTKQEATT